MRNMSNSFNAADSWQTFLVYLAQAGLQESRERLSWVSKLRAEKGFCSGGRGWSSGAKPPP